MPADPTPPMTFSQPTNRSARRALARSFAGAVAAVAAGLLAGGCEVKSFLDPTQLVDPKKENRLDAEGRATPIVQVILDDLDLGVGEPDGAYTAARDVRASDLEIVTEDYIVGPGDLLRVSIADFPLPGAQYVEPKLVSDTGNVNLPDVDEVRVQGLTEAEAADAIEERYVERGIFQPGVARINVITVTANNREYSIVGNAIGQPGRYPVTKPDYRLLDALAVARGISDSKVAAEYAYVIRETDAARAGRRRDGGAANPGGSGGGDSGVAPDENDPLRPRSDAGESADEWAAPAFAMQQGGPAGGAGGSDSDGFSFEAPQEPTDREVIRIPLAELLDGEQKYNIVIRPNDYIVAPAAEGGFFYVYGNANVSGSFQLVPGQRVTLKRAITSARGLNAVAVPQRTQLVRRYGDQDVFVRVDLAKIFVGQDPDLYLQPDDMVMIGTNFPAPFLATFRNAFRVTYGFGFLYDRNFARQREGNF